MPLAAADPQLLALAVLLGAAGLLVAAARTGIPYPVLLVVGGALLALVPGVPVVELEPDLVLVLFLPPLLYAAAFFTSLVELRRTARPVASLALGAVLATVGLVAVVAHEALGMSWGAAFVLGAVLGPTDPVAATAIAGRLGAPRRFVAIVEGESLINDAVALIAFRVAVTAAVTGAFSPVEAAAEFVLGAAGGVLVGAVVGAVATRVRQLVRDAPTEIAISFLVPYVAYLPAEAIGASAVLAAVTTGVWLGWRAPRTLEPATRIQALATWEVLVFVLNAALFVLVGFQLPVALEGLGDVPAGALVLDALLVVAAVTAARFGWVTAVGSGPRGRGEPPRNRRLQVLTAFTGLRGAVSLAAALAVPEALPERDRIVFLAYAVVFATVVVQGLALPAVIRALGLGGGAREAAVQEDRARVEVARAAIARLDELTGEGWVGESTVRRMRDVFAFRVRRFEARLDEDDDGVVEDRSRAYQRLRREVLAAERERLLELRDAGAISDEVLRRVQRDIDLEDVRLE